MNRALGFLTQPPIRLRIIPEGVPQPGGSFRIAVISTNATGAHSIPTGLLDIVKVWMKIEVSDAGGRVVYRSGYPSDPGGGLDPLARRLGAILYDPQGKVIEDHRFWNIDRAEVRAIQLGEDWVETFDLPLPEDVELPLRVVASWNYRRYHASIAEEIFGPGTRFPALMIAEVSWSSG
jgi:hypothetical protein